MSQATQEIADLDFSLAADGQTVTLARGSASVQCAAFVRTRQLIPNEPLVDTLSQQEFLVIISPTQIDEATWPAPANSPPLPVDQRIPIKGDRIIIAGRMRAVQSVLPMFVADVLVRIEMKVLG